MSIRGITQLYDAHLTGIDYLPDRTISLRFTTVDSARVQILLSGVVSFFCTGMLENNIVLNLEVLDTEDISVLDLAYFVEKEARGRAVSSLQEAIQSNRLSMLLLSPAYGAELACICAGVAQT